MDHTPVLKPREVGAILSKLGFVEVQQRGSHKHYRPLTVDVPQCRFTLGETFRRRCFTKSPKTFASQLMSCLPAAKQIGNL